MGPDDASLKRYKAILNEIEDGVGETDLNGNLIFVTDSGCKMWGYRQDELLGSNFKSYVDAQGAKLLKKMYNKVYQTAQPIRFTHDVIQKNGAIIIVEDSVSPILSDSGNVVGFRSVQRNVTDRELAWQEVRAHRKRLEAIFRSVSDAIIMVDTNMQVIEANDSTMEICGVTKPVTGEQSFKNPAGQCSKQCCEVLSQTLKNRRNISGYTLECKHTKGDHQIVSINSSPITNQEGELIGAVMVVRDITVLNELQKELRQRHQFHNIIGSSKQMQSVYSLLENLTDLNTTVMVLGETGTGKELVARAIHYEGQRSLKPFVAVNCSALSENLLESELFGHAKGAFTGATMDKMGRFEAANGGTILLDEIGDISPLIQLKLLRVLQEKVIERVGEIVSRKVDARVIACTNSNLKEKVATGKFREDLYYRLKVVQVDLPPLRKRLEDIPMLVDHFIATFNEKFEKKIEGVSQDVINLFMSYEWPGNVRELEHAMEHAFILCRSTLITLAHLPMDIMDTVSQKKHMAQDLLTKKKSCDVDNILAVLEKTDGNKAKAARILGISRRTIYRKLDAQKKQP